MGYFKCTGGFYLLSEMHRLDINHKGSNNMVILGDIFYVLLQNVVYALGTGRTSTDLTCKLVDYPLRKKIPVNFLCIIEFGIEKSQPLRNGGYDYV